MAKKTLGYGFKLSSESFLQAVALYDGISGGGGGLHKTKKAVLAEIKKAKIDGDISRTSKPKVFKITIETQE